MTTQKIYIDSNGWTTDQVKTVAQCDEAEAALGAAIASIEAQLATGTDIEWVKKAHHALIMKKRAISIITRLRGRLKAAERRSASETFQAKFVAIVHEQHPDVFQEVSAALAA